MGKTIVALTHGRDLDGIASAAIIYRFSKIRNYKCKLYFSEPYNLSENLEKILLYEKVFDELVIADIGLNREISSVIISLLRRVKERNVLIKWFDHHIWDDDLVESIRKIVDLLKVDSRFCAAELVQINLLPRDSIARRIALLARDMDFWLKKDELSVKISKIIRSGNVSKNEIIEKLSEGIFWDKGFQEIYDKLSVFEKEIIEKALKNTETYYIKKLKVAFVKGKAPAGLIADTLAEKNYDIIVVISPTGKISLRRGKESINLVPIAKKLGGGGHPYAAGAMLNYNAIDRFLAKFFGIFRKKDKILKVIEETIVAIGEDNGSNTCN